MAEIVVDVAIVGGGLVGTSLAVALANTQLKLALIDAVKPPASAPSWDERCIALNDGSRRIFEGMRVWDALRVQAQPILSTHISERGRFGVARFTAAEAGLAALGHNTPLRAVGGVLLSAAQARLQAHLQWLCPARVTALALDARSARLTLDDGRSLSAKLVVAADGASSSLRSLLGFGAEVRDYQQSAIVTAVRVQRDPAGVAYERFTPDGPFAVLPKPRLAEDVEAGHPCSLIWTLPTARAEDLHALPDAEFVAAAQTAFGERLGRFLGIGKRIVYPLQRTVNHTLSAPRVVFCGNAAQSLHPVAAQGFNLGLRDVATLAACLREAAAQDADLGDSLVLSDYAASREDDRRRTADFTDQLVRVFSNRLPVISSLRSLGLVAMDLLPPAKEAVLRQNLGHAGLAA
ncbi:MAG: 2-octaprenyl-6-methoxyphenyl hydroxylase [Pseudomonadota bacterium]